MNLEIFQRAYDLFQDNTNNARSDATIIASIYSALLSVHSEGYADSMRDVQLAQKAQRELDEVAETVARASWWSGVEQQDAAVDAYVKSADLQAELDAFFYDVDHHPVSEMTLDEIQDAIYGNFTPGTTRQYPDGPAR